MPSSSSSASGSSGVPLFLVAFLAFGRFALGEWDAVVVALDFFDGFLLAEMT